VTNPIEDLDAWLARGKELRTALMREREKLMARMLEIDTALAKLPRGESSEQNGHLLSLDDLTLADGIKAVLKMTPNGLSAHALRDRMGGEEKINIRSLYSTLNRLAKSGGVRVSGDRGQQMYFWREES
jgi:hypothetical protein